MKLSLFSSRFLNNNIYHFPNCQKISEQYNKNSAPCVRHTEQFQQLLRARFVDFEMAENCLEHLLALLKHHTNTLDPSYISK